MKVVAIAIVVFIAGLVVGFQMGAAILPAASLLRSTSTVYLGTASQVRARVDLVEYCFSPGGDCAGVVVKWIGRANSSVHVLIYTFTLNNVANALMAAKNRGVDVKIVMERSEVSGSGAQYQNLKSAGVDIRLDTNPALMHDKVAIIDGHIIVTGSFNYSVSANLSNNENLVVIDDRLWASAFETQFQQIYSQATA